MGAISCKPRSKLRTKQPSTKPRHPPTIQNTEILVVEVAGHGLALGPHREPCKHLPESATVVLGGDRRRHAAACFRVRQTSKTCWYALKCSDSESESVPSYTMRGGRTLIIRLVER